MGRKPARTGGRDFADNFVRAVERARRIRLIGSRHLELRHFASNYCNLAYSALACFRTGTSGSAFFHSAKKSWYALFDFAVSPARAYARPSPRRARAPIGALPTILA